MINRMKWATVTCCMLLFACIFGVGQLSATVDKKGSTSCKSCHADIAQLLPEKHPAVSGASVSACVKCHVPAVSEKAEAKSYFARMHIKHAGADPKVSCSTCHIYKPAKSFGLIGTKISWGKPGKEDMALAEKTMSSWAGSRNMDAIHAKQNVGCQACHGSTFPVKGDTVENERCSDCHGTYEKLAAKTMNVKVPNRNPHDSHLGEIGCVVCHHAHSTSEAYCNGCHSKYDMKIPGGK